LFTLLANGYLIASEPPALLIEDAQCINEHIDIVITTQNVAIAVFHFLLQFNADIVQHF
jgi:hypothetical protein